MDSRDFPTIFDYFNKKIDQINEIIPLVKLICFDSSSTDASYDHFDCVLKLSELPGLLAEMEDMLILLDKEIERQKSDLFKKRDELLTKMELIGSHCDHISDFRCKFASLQITSKPTKTGVNPVKTNVPKAANGLKKASAINKKQSSIPKGSKTIGIPIIEPISKSEFLSIPQYMRGRITHEMINQALSSFITTLKCKYNLMNTNSSKLTEEQCKRLQMYKYLENSETVDHYFCTIDDLKLYSNLKDPTNSKNLLTCLRHCKRVKEIRGPGKIIRYAIPK